MTSVGNVCPWAHRADSVFLTPDFRSTSLLDYSRVKLCRRGITDLGEDITMDLPTRLGVFALSPKAPHGAASKVLVGKRPWPSTLSEIRPYPAGTTVGPRRGVSRTPSDSRPPKHTGKDAERYRYDQRGLEPHLLGDASRLTAANRGSG